MKPTWMALLVPQRTDTSFEVPASDHAGAWGQRARAAGAAARLAQERGPVASVSSPYFYLVGVFPYADLFPTWIQFQAKRLSEAAGAQRKKGALGVEERAKEITLEQKQAAKPKSRLPQGSPQHRACEP